MNMMENVNFVGYLCCQAEIKSHKFNKYDGKCEYCSILGCKAGLIKHKFNEYDEKCEYCYMAKNYWENNFLKILKKRR